MNEVGKQVSQDLLAHNPIMNDGSSAEATVMSNDRLNDCVAALDRYFVERETRGAQ